MADAKPTDIDELIAAWRGYCNTVEHWQELVQGIKPIPSGCGPIYELTSPLDRPNEDFAIADMRNITFAEPHYHPKDNWEFYVVLEGTATVFVGKQSHKVKKGDIVAIPPQTAHFTIPDTNFVIAAINTPPFRPENYIKLTVSNPSVGYDHEQFKKLVAK